MQINKAYDVAIVGGGLAGLAASIQMAVAGYSVILFEKERYPFHKVCGEYISLESRSFLLGLGLPLDQMDLPLIDTLLLTAPGGSTFTTSLPLGGFGISRYTLDAQLAGRARKAGVHVLEETKVDDVRFDGRFRILFRSQQIESTLCFAAYGKRSNLDIKWKRNPLSASGRRLDNLIGIKYHVRTDWKENVIGLHNFRNGYCGISKIEEDRYCLCYLARAEDLKACHSNLQELEETILYKNPHLKALFTHCEKAAPFPVTISQISFQKKSQVENHVLMLGDTAGMITPLCGNGMSIALHTAKMAAALGSDFLQNKISRSRMEQVYRRQWKHQFAGRLRTGRLLQYFFGGERLTNLLVGTMKRFPFLAAPLIKMTHGKPF